MSTDPKKVAANTKAMIEKRAEEERARIAADRTEHQKAMDAEAKARAAVLDKAMKGLSDGEQKQVRLNAAIIVANRGGIGPNQKQAAHDDVALALAKYMALGEV